MRNVYLHTREVQVEHIYVNGEKSNRNISSEERAGYKSLSTNSTD